MKDTEALMLVVDLLSSSGSFVFFASFEICQVRFGLSLGYPLIHPWLIYREVLRFHGLPWFLDISAQTISRLTLSFVDYVRMPIAFGAPSWFDLPISRTFFQWVLVYIPVVGYNPSRVASPHLLLAISPVIALLTSCYPLVVKHGQGKKHIFKHGSSPSTLMGDFRTPRMITGFFFTCDNFLHW